MPPKEKTEKLATLTEEEPEVYEVNYIVNFNECTFNDKVVINQKGVPPDPPIDPPEKK